MNKRTLWLGLGTLIGGLAVWKLMKPGREKPHLAATTERDGVGPATLRRYWTDIEGATKAPEEVIKEVLDHFNRIMPWPLAMTFKVRGQPGQGALGDRYLILMLVRVGYVETEVIESLRFRNRTLRPHAESGWVEFRAIPSGKPEDGAYRLQIQSSVRTSTLADRLAYLLGMSYAQSANWHTVLRRAARLSGGTVTNTGRDTGEFEHVPGGVKAPQTRPEPEEMERGDTGKKEN